MSQYRLSFRSLALQHLCLIVYTLAAEAFASTSKKTAPKTVPRISPQYGVVKPVADIFEVSLLLLDLHFSLAPTVVKPRGFVISMVFVDAICG